MRRLHPNLRPLHGCGPLALLFPLFAAGPAAATCAQALDRPPSFREDQSALAPGASLCYAVQVPAAGLWLVDVSNPAAGPADLPARLTVVGRSCDDDAGDRRGAQVLHRMAGGAILQVHHAGRHLFCVAGRDPEQVLPRFRVTSLYAGLHLKGDPDEDEPDPDPIVDFPGGEASIGSPLGSSPGRRLGDLLDGFSSACTALGDDVVRDSGRPEDDHADLWACATAVPIGRTMAGRFNDSGDDLDVFRFRVEDWEVYLIESSSPSDVAAELVDARGYLLLANDGGRPEGGFRIIELLAPGEYFLELRSASAEYRLGIRRLASP